MTLGKHWRVLCLHFFICKTKVINNSVHFIGWIYLIVPSTVNTISVFIVDMAVLGSAPLWSQGPVVFLGKAGRFKEHYLFFQQLHCESFKASPGLHSRVLTSFLEAYPGCSDTMRQSPAAVSLFSGPTPVWLLVAHAKLLWCSKHLHTLLLSNSKSLIHLPHSGGFVHFLGSNILVVCSLWPLSMFPFYFKQALFWGSPMCQTLC